MPLEALTKRVDVLEQQFSKWHTETLLHNQHMEDLLKTILRNQSESKENMVHRYEFSPVQKIVYGGAGVILTTVLGSGLALIIMGAK